MNSNHQSNVPNTDELVSQGPTVKIQDKVEAIPIDDSHNGLCRSDVDTSESEAEDLVEQTVINQSIEVKRNSRRSQRMSVCAEVYGQYNPKGQF